MPDPTVQLPASPRPDAGPGRADGPGPAATARRGRRSPGRCSSCSAWACGPCTGSASATSGTRSPHGASAPSTVEVTAGRHSYSIGIHGGARTARCGPATSRSPTCTCDDRPGGQRPDAARRRARGSDGTKALNQIATLRRAGRPAACTSPARRCRPSSSTTPTTPGSTGPGLWLLLGLGRPRRSALPLLLRPPYRRAAVRATTLTAEAGRGQHARGPATRRRRARCSTIVEVGGRHRRDVAAQRRRPALGRRRRAGRRRTTRRAGVAGRRAAGPACSPSTRSTANPHASAASTSSAAVNSSVWNGFSGASRPGEKVSRFGVVTSSSPPGAQHPAALADELRVVPDVLDHLQRGERRRPPRRRTGSAARLPRTNRASG